MSKTISGITGRPNIQPIAQSSLLSRLQTFLPKMEEANKSLTTVDAADCGVEIVDSAEDQAESSSSSSRESASDEEKEIEPSVKKGDRVEMDLDIFREEGTAVDERDVAVQPVTSLPEAFNRVTTAAEYDVKALESLKDLYGDLAQIPIPTQGRIGKKKSEKCIEVTTVWDNRALALNKSTRTQRVSLICTSSSEIVDRSVISSTSVPLCNFESQAVAYSASNTRCAQLITIPDGNDKKQYLKVRWEQIRRLTRFNADSSANP
ncbi:unnamed protein product [Caenorhabditis auriculariae]|uniref:Uncharacterized protein n=1 Tax=Caenorhabditis auriculariae TaxID=2777116 RepID=A0A8S1HJP6_9PELO|nr:unnamed protein product [Caenorhabditis auriculariae]